MPAAKDPQTEKVPLTEKLNDLIHKNRQKLFIALIAVVVILAAFVIITTVRDKMTTDALSKADAFNRRYEALKKFISGEDPEAASKQADIDALLEELAAFTAKSSGFASARAHVIIAGIQWDKKNWAEAEKAWMAASAAAAKTYLAPISIYNAAVAAEEQGNLQSAIDLYTKAVNYGTDFPAAARAQFSIGRLEETQNNSSAALEAYRALVNKWPNDAVWINLAQSRIIVLSE